MEKEKTMKDIFNTLSDEQKTLLYFFVGKALGKSHYQEEISPPESLILNLKGENKNG